ncbi:MAG TPA: hypothetical protein VLX90_19450 [Steroidobacteraceae bacterium]|nr:hypothetical protein [Steroidobacteraceae bacterium]
MHTIAAPDQAAPLEFAFDIAAAGTYQITLVDLGQQFQAPLASVQLALTGGTSQVGSTLIGAGSMQFNAMPGTYVVHVVGTPGKGLGSGPVGIQVTDSSGQTQIKAFSGTLAPPQQPLPSSEAALSDTINIDSADNYTVALTDLQFPQALGILQLLLIQTGSATPALLLGMGDPPTQVALTPGQYSLLAVGATSSSATDGLYSVVVTSSSGAVIDVRTVPVGGTSLLGSTPLSPGSYTLTATDLGLPMTLGRLGALVTVNGQLVSQVTGSASAPFSINGAAQVTAQTFGSAAAQSSGAGAGSYAVQLQLQGGAMQLSEARAVVSSTSALRGYFFDVPIAMAGSHTAVVTDFTVPAALSGVNWGVIQSGQLLKSVSGAGSGQFSAVPGTANVLVFARPGPTGGLFDLSVTRDSDSLLVSDTTQGVGALFRVSTLGITSPGSYSVTAADLGFPANLANFALVVTRQGQQSGAIFGAGQFNFAATPGTYFVSIIAQPSGTAHAGTYALTLATAPAPPNASLQSDANSVASGQTVHLIWSSQNATSCTASSSPTGVWSGTLATSGTAMSNSISQATTFSINCNGPGGSAAAMATVSVAPPSSGGKGGGGALSLDLLLLLGAALAWRCLETLRLGRAELSGMSRMRHFERLASASRAPIHKRFKSTTT